MNIRDLLRVVVRLQGYMLLFYALIDATYLGPYIRAFNYAKHPTFLVSNTEVENLGAAILRIVLHAMLALALIARTDEIIDRLLGRTVLTAGRPGALHQKSPESGGGSL